MSFFGLILILGGLGFLCWLLFALAIYALPVFVGLSIAVPAFHSGAGYVGALVVAMVSAAVVFGAGKFAMTNARSPISRWVIGLLYAVPAAIAGYQATLGLARIGTPSEAWCVTFAIVGAVVVGATAWQRLAGMTAPVPARTVA